jgi:hypothetical protein
MGFFLTLSPPTLVSNQVEFTLTGEAGVPYVIETSSDTTHWLAVVTNTSPESTRSIVLAAPTHDATLYRAWREPQPMFLGALVARSSITMSGNNILVDSYDSGDPNHADPLGRYDPNTRKAGGDVCSAEGFLNVGNADIKGKLYSSPLNGEQYSIGLNGSVGDLSWVGPGLQPGWNGTNFHWALPDVRPPYPTGLTPTGQGTNYWYLVDGDYLYNGNVALSSAQIIYVAGNATLFVTGVLDCKGRIIIAPGASLKLYVGGITTKLNQVNTAGGPTSFQYYGLPTNLSLSWGGNNEYVGTIYAPQATVKLGGGGSDTYDFCGACVAQSVSIYGSFSVHYDENLKRTGPKR